MPLGIRIFLVYVLFIGLTGYFVLSTVMEEIRPGVRQSTEETLVDTANLMAEILRDDFKAGTLSQNRWPELLRAYGERQPKANIWGCRRIRSTTVSTSLTPRALWSWIPAVWRWARITRAGTTFC